MRVRGWVYESKADWKNVEWPYTGRIPIACLRTLLEYEAMADPGTRARFGRWARGDCRDVRFEVDLAIARKMGRDFQLSRQASPNLNRFFMEACKLERAGSYQDAARIYKGVTEAIGVHMDLMPDKGGGCHRMMRDALKSISWCVQAAGLDDAGRREEIRYLAEWSMRVIDRFAADYGEALADICRDVEDLDVWQSVLDDPPDVEDGYSDPQAVAPGSSARS